MCPPIPSYVIIFFFFFKDAITYNKHTTAVVKCKSRGWSFDDLLLVLLLKKKKTVSTSGCFLNCKQ